MEKWVYALLSVQFTSVHWLSRVWLFATPRPAAHQASLSITKSLSLLKLKSVESVMPSNHLILCRPLLLLPSIFSSIRVLSSESILCIRWPKYWSFSFSISPSNEYSGPISFRIDWFDLLEVQGTLSYLLHALKKKKKLLYKTHSIEFTISDNWYLYNVAQLSPLSSFRIFLSLQKETPYSLRSHFPFSHFSCSWQSVCFNLLLISLDLII